MINQEETWALAILTASANDARGELDRRIKARQAHITLLETKYKVNFDEQTGQFTKKE